MRKITLLEFSALPVALLLLPAMMDAIADEEPTAAKSGTEMPAPTIDTNGDGVPDAWDTSGDGKPDAWDTDGDGKPDVFDKDGDGKPD